MTTVTLADAKWQLRIDTTDEDQQVQALLDRATAFLEQEYGILLSGQESEQVYDGFGPLRLDVWPVERGADVQVAYTAADGTEATIDDARVAVTRRPGYVVPAIGKAWPATSGQPGAVTVTVWAGFDDVPLAIRQAILLLVAHWYGNRSAAEVGARAAAIEIPLGVEVLMRPYRLMVV